MPTFDFRRGTTRLVYFSGLAVFAASILFGAMFLELRQRDDEILHHQELATIQVRGYEDYLTQSLNNADLALRNSLDPQDLQHGFARVGESFRLTLRVAPLLRSISLLDNEGRIVASSNQANLGRRPALRDLVAAAQEHVDLPVIGTPWVGRDFDNARPTSHAQPADGQALVFLPIVRQVVIANRAYTLLAAINTDYFLNHLSRQPQPLDRIVRILHHDGTLLLSTNDQERPGSLMESFRFGDREFHAGFQTNIQERPTLIAYRSSRRYPVAMTLTVDRESVLGAWRREMTVVALTIGSSLALLCGLAFLFYLRMTHAARRQEQADQRLRLAATVFDASPDGIVVADVAGNIVSVNPAFVATTGYRAEELIGSNPRILSSGHHASTFYDEIWRALEMNGVWRGEIVNRRRTGEVSPEWLSITRVLDEDGAVSSYVGVFSQITDPKADEARVSFLKSHDFLTGLPNFSEFEKNLTQAMGHHRRIGGRLAVLWIGLETLGAINAKLSYRAGDAVLVAAAQRLRSGLREADAICRVSGAKFLVLIEAIEAAQEATDVGLRLVDALLAPYAELPSDMQVEAHAGITISTEMGLDASSLIRAAKGAYMAAKRRGVRVV